MAQEKEPDKEDSPTPADVLPSDETLQAQYEQQYKDMVRQFTAGIEDRTNPMAQRAEQAYRNYETSSVASAFHDELKERTGGELETSGVLLFFISSSMPERTIKTYMAQAEAINTRIMFVIRGTIDNTVQLLPTINYMKELKTFTGCGEPLCQRAVNTVIDSRLFEQYGITQVPALVYTGEFSNKGYFDNHALPAVTNPTVIAGEATLPFLVKTLSEEINDEGLTAIAKTYSF
jgi:type-F conjugative transfer system pilin assembly protein TrbC